jgi:hypothetical protein
VDPAGWVLGRVDSGGVLDGQALAALGAARIDHGAAPAGLHANKKAMGAGTADFRGLVSALHGKVLASSWRVPGEFSVGTDRVADLIEVSGFKTLDWKPKWFRETHDYSKKRQSGQTLAPQAGPHGGG